MSIKKEKIGSVIGKIEESLLVRVNRALALWLGLV
jgi:mRNA interferase MazF